MLSFFGALTYAELGAMRPQAGGEYVYVRDAYGPLPAFLYAWTWFVIAKPASIASVTIGIVRVLGTFPALAFFSATILHSKITYGQLVAIAATIFISFLNYIGIKKAGDFQLFFTVLKIAIVLGIVAVGFSYSHGTWSNFSGTFIGAKGGIAGFMAALVAALWAYDGWNDLNMVAGEIQKPERSIPFALVAGVATVGILYMLMNAAVQYAMPASAIAASARPASDTTGLGVWSYRSCRRFRSNGVVYARHTQRHDHERRACAFCRGSRWIFLFCAGQGSSAIPYAFNFNYRAGNSVDCSAFTRRKFQAAVFAGHFCGMAFLHDCRQHDFCFPAA